MKINSGNVARDDRQTLSCDWREVQAVPASYGCPRIRSKHAACLHGNQVYICSGKASSSPLRDIWRYHLGAGKWERMTFRGSPLPHLEGHTMLSYKQLLLIFGGEFSTGTSEAPLWIINMEQLHIHKPSVDMSLPQPTSRRDHSAIMHWGVMYIYGGFVDLRGSSSELWGYNCEEDMWKLYPAVSAEQPGGRHGHSCVVYNNLMWMYGGLCDLSIKAELWAYNFVSQRWQKVKCAPSPPPMTGHSANVVNENMVVIGGENQGEIYQDVWIYNFDYNLWRKITHHSSPYMPLPCSQHATVCITKKGHDETGEDNSARCFSEPALQSPVSQTSNALSRPRTSPSGESGHLSSKWVYPIKSASRNCDILSLELQSINSADTQNVGSSRVNTLPSHVSRLLTVEDQRPLLRFVSRDSTDSVGIDNVIDCTADEIHDDTQPLPTKLCSTTGLSDQRAQIPDAKETSVHTAQNHLARSIDSQHNVNMNQQNIYSNSAKQPMTSTSNSGQERNSPNPVYKSHDSKYCATLRESAQEKKDSVNGVNLPPQASRTATPKPICSRYCDDMIIEDIEEQNTSAEAAKISNPFIFTKDELRDSKNDLDWFELDTYSNDQSEVKSSWSNKESAKSNFHNDATEISPNETPFIKGGNVFIERNEGMRKMLVTVATQTGSNLDLRPQSAEVKDSTKFDSEILLDGAPYLIVLGGKGRKGLIQQQSVKLWRCDVIS